ASGWYEREFDATAVPFRQRGQIFERNLDLMLRLWADDDVTGEWDGRVLTHVRMLPLPRPRPQLLIGGARGQERPPGGRRPPPRRPARGRGRGPAAAGGRRGAPRPGSGWSPGGGCASAPPTRGRPAARPSTSVSTSTCRPGARRRRSPRSAAPRSSAPSRSPP